MCLLLLNVFSFILYRFFSWFDNIAQSYLENKIIFYNISFKNNYDIHTIMTEIKILN